MSVWERALWEHAMHRRDALKQAVADYSSRFPVREEGRKMWGSAFVSVPQRFFFSPHAVDDGCGGKPRGGEEDRVLPGAVAARGRGQIHLLQGEATSQCMIVFLAKSPHARSHSHYTDPLCPRRCSKGGKSWSRCWAFDSPEVPLSQRSQREMTASEISFRINVAAFAFAPLQGESRDQQDYWTCL